MFELKHAESSIRYFSSPKHSRHSRQRRGGCVTAVIKQQRSRGGDWCCKFIVYISVVWVRVGCNHSKGFYSCCQPRSSHTVAFSNAFSTLSHIYSWAEARLAETIWINDSRDDKTRLMKVFIIMRKQARDCKIINLISHLKDTTLEIKHTEVEGNFSSPGDCNTLTYVSH